MHFTIRSKSACSVDAGVLNTLKENASYGWCVAKRDAPYIFFLHLTPRAPAVLGTPLKIPLAKGEGKRSLQGVVVKFPESGPDNTQALRDRVKSYQDCTFAPPPLIRENTDIFIHGGAASRHARFPGNRAETGPLLVSCSQKTALSWQLCMTTIELLRRQNPEVGCDLQYSTPGLEVIVCFALLGMRAMMGLPYRFAEINRVRN